MQQQIIFTSQEVEVIQLICQQYFTNEIAKKLSISKTSVQAIQENLRVKMGVKGIPGIVVYAIKHNIYKIK